MIPSGDRERRWPQGWPAPPRPEATWPIRPRPCDTRGPPAGPAGDARGGDESSRRGSPISATANRSRGPSDPPTGTAGRRNAGGSKGARSAPSPAPCVAQGVCWLLRPNRFQEPVPPGPLIVPPDSLSSSAGSSSSRPWIFSRSRRSRSMSFPFDSVPRLDSLPVIAFVADQFGGSVWLVGGWQGFGHGYGVGLADRVPLLRRWTDADSGVSVGCAARSFIASRGRSNRAGSLPRPGSPRGVRRGGRSVGSRMPWSCRSVFGPDACVRPIIATRPPRRPARHPQGRNAE